MKAPRRFRWSAAPALLVSTALLGFLSWRTFSIAHRLPALLRMDGVREGLTLPLEERFRRALAQAPVTRSAAAENARVLALLRTHVEPHAHVLVELERGRGGKELAGLLTTLAFPRSVQHVRMAEVERDQWPGLAGKDGLYALLRTDAGESACGPSRTRAPCCGSSQGALVLRADGERESQEGEP